MTPVILSPFANWLLILIVFLLIPMSILAPHTVVWEVIIGGLVGIYYSQKQCLIKLPQPLIAILFAFPLWGLVTTLWATPSLPSFLISLKVFALVLLGIYWCRLTLSLPPTTQKSLINALMSGFFLGLLFLVIEVWSGNPWKEFRNKTATKVYAQGSLIVSLAVWPAIFWVVRKTHYPLILRISFVICFLLSILWIFFRIDCDTTFIGLFLGLCVFAGTLILPRVTSWGMRLFVPLFIFSFPFISLYAFKPEYMPMYNSYLAHIPAQSYLERLYIWNEVATTTLEHPWKGIGIGGSPFHEKRKIIREWSFTHMDGIAEKFYTELFPMHPHNAILQLWLELGFLGIVLGTLFAYLILFQIYRTNLLLMEKAVCSGLFGGAFLITWVSLGFWQNWWISGLWMIIGLTIMLFKNKRRTNESVLA